jgi:thioredoxin-related protein
MVALTIVETVLLIVALVYIVALLRSHADILRRLAALEDGVGPQTPARAPGPAGGSEVLAADEITGITLAGDAVTLSFGPGSPVTLLAFLTSGCASCAPLWAGLREDEQVTALAERVVIVTHDATRESPTRLRAIAPERVEAIMATAAWEDYAVPASPHFVLTDGAGGILGRGSALSWSQLQAMVHEARADADALGEAPARTTAQRAARSQRTLARAGIGPGHPSLHPGETTRPHAEDR